MNRRDFLFLKSNRRNRSLELSCEQLYMRYRDSHLDGTTKELFERLEGELRDVDELRLVDSTWLAREDLRRELEPLLVSVRARGGRVKFLRAPASSRPRRPRTA